jgi:hypothetical protein
MWRRLPNMPMVTAVATGTPYGASSATKPISRKPSPAHETGTKSATARNERIQPRIVQLTSESTARDSFGNLTTGRLSLA